MSLFGAVRKRSSSDARVRCARARCAESERAAGRSVGAESEARRGTARGTVVCVSCCCCAWVVWVALVPPPPTRVLCVLCCCAALRGARFCCARTPARTERLRTGGRTSCSSNADTQRRHSGAQQGAPSPCPRSQGRTRVLHCTTSSSPRISARLSPKPDRAVAFVLRQAARDCGGEAVVACARSKTRECGQSRDVARSHAAFAGNAVTTVHDHAAALSLCSLLCSAPRLSLPRLRHALASSIAQAAARHAVTHSHSSWPRRPPRPPQSVDPPLQPPPPQPPRPQQQMRSGVSRLTAN